MISIIEDVVYKVTGRRGITGDMDFVKDLGLNSFDIVNIVGAFEDKYKITIPTRDIWQLHTVNDVAAYLKKRGIKG